MGTIISKILTIIVSICGFVLIMPFILCFFVLQIFSEATMTPVDVFTSSVNNTIPDSVEIIDYQAYLIGMDDSYWIHFKINSQDLNNIIQDNSYNYEFKEVERKEWDGAYINHPPEWWNAENFSEEGSFYDCVNTESEYFCSMFVSENEDEVYFVYGTF